MSEQLMTALSGRSSWLMRAKNSDSPGWPRVSGRHLLVLLQQRLPEMRSFSTASAERAVRFEVSTRTTSMTLPSAASSRWLKSCPAMQSPKAVAR